MDKFFTATKCDRCGGRLDIRIMSVLNTDALCENCSESEKTHPRYEEAKDREHEEVLKGNHFYEGILAGQKYPFNK